MSTIMTIRASARAALLGAAALFSAGALYAQETEGGKTLYVTYGCYQCHGYEGQGGVSGPRIGPSPYPFLTFSQLVRRPANVMPAYAPSVLDDATLETIYQYVRAVPEPADGDDIALLR
jgi:mono/diheme cytochrome c family protein